MSTQQEEIKKRQEILEATVFGFKDWCYKEIYIVLLCWLEKVLFQLVAQEISNPPQKLSLQFKKIGRTKFVSYKHSRDTSVAGEVGRMIINTRYLKSPLSPQYLIGFIVIMAYELARCVVLRTKTPNAKRKVLASIKEINERLEKIGLKFKGNKLPVAEAYEFSLNSWLFAEIKKEFNDDANHISYLEYEPKEVKQQLEQITIENSVVNANTIISEEISTLKENLADAEENNVVHEKDIKMLQEQNNLLATQLREVKKQLEEALKPKVVMSPVPEVKEVKVESAPAPAPEIKKESEKPGVLMSIVSSIFGSAKKKSESFPRMQEAHLALLWLKENEASVRSIDKKFAYNYAYLAKKIGISQKILEKIEQGKNEQLNPRSHCLVMNFAKRRGYVVSAIDKISTEPVNQPTSEPVAEQIPQSIEIDENEENDEPMTNEERENAAITEVSDAIHEIVAECPKEMNQIVQELNHRSFIFFRSQIGIAASITRLLDNGSLKYIGNGNKIGVAR